MAHTAVKGKAIDWSGITLYTFLSIFAVLMLSPLIYLVSTAFKPYTELFLFPPRFWVMDPTTKNFRDLFLTASPSFVPVTRYLFNSIVASSAIVGLGILISTMAAFPLSKHYSMPFRKGIFKMVVLALMFAPQVVQIPQFLIMSQIGLMNNYLALVLPAFAAPLGLFLIKQFLDQVPDVLLEAAHVDGASQWRIYWQIILPLISPAIATMALFTFVSAWNDGWASTYLMTQEQMKTLAFQVSTISGGNNTIARQGAVAAASFVMIIPTILVFVLTQRKVIETMAHSGIKG